MTSICGSSVKKSVETTSTSAANDLECEIVKQGDLVRQLKAADPKSVESKAAIAKLLELKKKFKEVTGAEYKPKPATTTGGDKEKKKP
ncbi:unnamed protein product, partial [Anisakis simplex]|uniref:WHEP-TRS domain-containing protein n=1 Tax=Anisakis simplex TaxID=6269 RepID=A0A0M3JMK2_ANISI